MKDLGLLYGQIQTIPKIKNMNLLSFYLLHMLKILITLTFRPIKSNGIAKQKGVQLTLDIEYYMDGYYRILKHYIWWLGFLQDRCPRNCVNKRKWRNTFGLNNYFKRQNISKRGQEEGPIIHVCTFYPTYQNCFSFCRLHF